MQNSSKASRLRSLKVLNDEIFHVQSRQDPKLVKRVVIPEVLDSKLVLVGQAPGRSTQRLSGIPYVKPGHGRRLSATGQKLNRVLLPFGYTIDPGDRGHQYAYVTDVVHHFPGKREASAGDIAPTASEILRSSTWLDRELEIVSPALVVAVGLVATQELFGRFLNLSVPTLKSLDPKPQLANVHGRDTYLTAIYHPASWNHKDADLRSKRVRRHVQELRVV